MGIANKICRECKINKPICEFAKDSRSKDHLSGNCKTCQKKYRDNNKERLKTYFKQYYKDNIDKRMQYEEDNKERRQKYSMEYGLKNKDRIKQYREDNKDKIKAAAKRYREENRTKILAHLKKYREENGDKIKTYREKNKSKESERKKIYRQTERGKEVAMKSKAIRRARKANVIEIEKFNPKEVLERDNYICQICGKKTRPDYNIYHQLYPNCDHIQPLNKGGSHTRINCQCSCRKCNLRKGDTENNGDQLRMFG